MISIDFHSAHSIRCTTWYIEYREICSLNKVKGREQFANPAKSELQRPNGFPGVCRRIMSCSFCISISGTDLRNLAYAFVCQIGYCCCCLCRNYLNKITKTYAAGNARWGIIRACPETDLMMPWSCCSFCYCQKLPIQFLPFVLVLTILLIVFVSRL